ncbi:MAG: carboxymuconolactone decarboxylase family protein, partial [Burkholderiaceae bacterium]
MSRLQPPAVADLDEAQRAVYDAIASGPRGGVRGPLAVWLWRPELAERAQALGQYCRYDSSLEPRLSELAILVTARHWSSEYEWQAHKKIGLQAGLAPNIVEAIRTSQTPEFTLDDEAAVYALASELLTERCIAQATYDRAIKVLGRDAVIDLVGVLGYYGFVSMTINVF